MKRQGNLLSFAFFGLFAQAIALMLLQQTITLQNSFGFLFAANAFMLYSVYIREKKQSWAAESYVKKEMRRWWLRSEPENAFAFALVGGILLTLCNFALWSSVRLLDIWAMSFVAIGLTQVLFESSRQLFNNGYAYLTEKVKQRKISRMEVKTDYGYSEDVDTSRC